MEALREDRSADDLAANLAREEALVSAAPTTAPPRVWQNPPRVVLNATLAAPSRHPELLGELARLMTDVRRGLGGAIPPGT